MNKLEKLTKEHYPLFRSYLTSVIEQRIIHVVEYADRRYESADSAEGAYEAILTCAKQCADHLRLATAEIMELLTLPVCEFSEDHEDGDWDAIAEAYAIIEKPNFGSKKFDYSTLISRFT